MEYGLENFLFQYPNISLMLLQYNRNLLKGNFSWNSGSCPNTRYRAARRSQESARVQDLGSGFRVLGFGSHMTQCRICLRGFSWLTKCSQISASRAAVGTSSQGVELRVRV